MELEELVEEPFEEIALEEAVAQEGVIEHKAYTQILKNVEKQYNAIEKQLCKSYKKMRKGFMKRYKQYAALGNNVRIKNLNEEYASKWSNHLKDSFDITATKTQNFKNKRPVLETDAIDTQVTQQVAQQEVRDYATKHLQKYHTAVKRFRSGKGHVPVYKEVIGALTGGFSPVGIGILGSVLVGTGVPAALGVIALVPGTIGGMLGTNYLIRKRALTFEVNELRNESYQDYLGE